MFFFIGGKMATQAVILASGYGQIRKNFPKVCEKIDGKAIIQKTAESVLAAGINEKKVIVTINSNFGEEVKKVLENFPIEFVMQPDRNGPADAVALALENVKANSVLIVFGDMPFWRPQTLKSVVEFHKQKKAVVALISLQIHEKTPAAIEQYGRILRNEKRKIIAIVEPGDLDEEMAKNVKTVNPSLYCFNVKWLKENIKNAPVREKSDGHPAERTLPPLVVTASKQKKKVVEIFLTDHYEAIGINTKEDLKFARRFFKK